VLLYRRWWSLRAGSLAGGGAGVVQKTVAQVRLSAQGSLFGRDGGAGDAVGGSGGGVDCGPRCVEAGGERGMPAGEVSGFKPAWGSQN
jgi:hypothetical protein